MNYKNLKIEENEKIALITISRPEAMNALNSNFFDEMNHYLDNLNSDIKAIIITGEGKAFVAGADISEMVNKNKAEAMVFSDIGQKTFERLEDLNIPVIAAVNGFALGGGCELALACDIRIATKFAKFGQPEVNLGLIPGYAGTQRLPRLIGLGNAMMLLLTADMINGEEAYRVGLVQKLSEPEALLDDAKALAKKIMSKGPMAIQKVKQVSRKGLLSTFEDGSSLEREHFSDLFQNEGKEGMTAFLEKRNPNW